MMSRFICFLAVLATGMLSHVGQVSGGMIVGNGDINDTSTGLSGRSFNSHIGYGKEFIVSANTTVRGASILLNGSGTFTPPTTSTFNVRIYSVLGDLGILDQPGPTLGQSVLASAQVIASFSSSGEGKWYHVDFGSGVSLTTTSYYVFAVEIASASNQNINWSPPTVSQSYSGNGAVDIYHYLSLVNGETIYKVKTDSIPQFGFQLTTEAVPEPTSAAIAVLFVGGGLLRRFRRTFV